MSAHEHIWRSTLHADGCHYYLWCYECECGATYEARAERDVRSNPYSAVWMDPEGREPCARCEELLAGATPERWATETTVDGAVTKSHSEAKP